MLWEIQERKGDDGEWRLREGRTQIREWEMGEGKGDEPLKWEGRRKSARTHAF